LVQFFDTASQERGVSLKIFIDPDGINHDVQVLPVTQIGHDIADRVVVDHIIQGPFEGTFVFEVIPKGFGAGFLAAFHDTFNVFIKVFSGFFLFFSADFLPILQITETAVPHRGGLIITAMGLAELDLTGSGLFSGRHKGTSL
jgi:hypothetical protein